MRIRKKIKKFIRRFTSDDDIAKIARRYLVMNSFDGALTILGVIVGTFFAEKTAHSSIIISAGFGTSLAMGISGFVGAYLTESSERRRYADNGDDGEEGDNNLHEESLFLALIDGLSPAIVTFIAVIPFILAMRNFITIYTAFISSVAIIMGELFGLGIILGKIAGKNIILHGLITLLAGAGTFLIISILPF